MCACEGIDSDARDKLLYALGRLVDSLVDVLLTPSSKEGVGSTIRQALISQLGELLNSSADEDDVYASRMVRA